ncbi:MAG TPA: ATP-binding protein [Verrucomicrobiae bacterium]|nr:ATP-binding protein [Verrucomicrobiae bacterium]
MKKLKEMPLASQVWLAFGAVCAILLVIGGWFFFSLRAIEGRNQQEQLRTLKKLALVDAMDERLGQAQASLSRKVLAFDFAKIQSLDRAIPALRQANDADFRDVLPYLDDAAERNIYTEAAQARNSYWEQTEKVMAFGRANRGTEATKLINEKQAPAYDQYREVMNKLVVHLEADVNDSAAALTTLIFRIRTVGDSLVLLAILIVLGASFVFGGIARRLNHYNQKLQDEVTARQQGEEQLRWKTALLEAQVNSSLDGILIVDQRGKKILQNQRTSDLLKIPPHISDNQEGEQQLRWVTQTAKNPAEFIERVKYIVAHPDEVSRDEVEHKDGLTLDRYSAPVIGKDGKRYGRIWTFRDITERKRSEEARDRLIAILESTTDLVSIADPQGHLIYMNRAGRKLLGVNDGDITKTAIRDFHPNGESHPVLTDAIPTAVREGVWSGESVLLSRTGREFPVSQVILAHKSKEGKVQFFSTVMRDITERKKLEAKLLQSQKMETVGKLAGGIAHEFNSILTAIIGQSELLQSELPAGAPSVKCAVEISQAASRAASLTRQLLAYGRKQFLQPEILNLNRVVTSMENVFRLLLGGNAAVQIIPAPDLKAVMADAGQIEQVIINMVINACDAMPNGGKLTLETANVSFEEESVGRYPELKPGEYVMLAITDTGLGMSEEVKARLFEPFFTTKAVGQGTGLGLSTCYGIVKQSGGHIGVYSELRRGTTFRIYLPQVEEKPKTPAQRSSLPAMPRGTETILLVEDDPALREMAGTLLRRQGYTVWTAANGVEALGLKQQEGVGHIDLLLTDVVMPHMSGKELADRVGALYPHTRILFTSAYTENAIILQGVLNKGVALLQKPFTPSALGRKVREVLEQ